MACHLRCAVLALADSCSSTWPATTGSKFQDVQISSMSCANVEGVMKHRAAMKDRESCSVSLHKRRMASSCACACVRIGGRGAEVAPLMWSLRRSWRILRSPRVFLDVTSPISASMWFSDWQWSDLPRSSPSPISHILEGTMKDIAGPRAPWTKLSQKKRSCSSGTWHSISNKTAAKPVPGLSLHIPDD